MDKKKNKQPMKEPLNMRVDKAFKEKLRVKAKEERRPITNLVVNVMSDYCDGKLAKKEELKQRFHIYKKRSIVNWQGTDYWVMEDNGDYNVLISNTLDTTDSEYNDWWVDKTYITEKA